MKIVRALWGDFLNNHRDEIPQSPQLDEIVFVWGKENLEYIESLGYETIYVNDIGDSFNLKLKALDLGHQMFGEILFLDWDCETDLKLETIRNLKLPSPCMPLYSYPKDYNDWDMLHEYSWDMNDMLVLPNACFIYTKDVNIGHELEKIVTKYKLVGLVEEFAMKIWSKCSLDEYIKKYDVPYLNGRDNSQYFVVNGEKVNTADKLNKYIGRKQILFKHH